MERIPETERKKSSEVKKEEVIKEESEEEPDYESDFDSLSLGNSLIRSRHSISNYMNSQKKEENESIFESGYSQDFESYSHSMLSNKKRTNSISEISESMKSISQSYRRPWLTIFIHSILKSYFNTIIMSHKTFPSDLYIGLNLSSLPSRCCSTPSSTPHRHVTIAVPESTHSTLCIRGGQTREFDD